MRQRVRALGLFLVLAEGSVVSGCGGDEGLTLPAPGDAGTSDASHGARGTPAQRPSSSAQVPPPPPRSGDDEPAAVAEDAGPSAPTCVPEGGLDVPDPDHADTNCDGIDGDAASAVFVANQGDDSADGTRNVPVQTLGRALTLARERGKRAIYVCAGSYPENVVIDSGIDVHGGFDCDDEWKRTRDYARVNPPSGVPLTVKDVSEPVSLHYLTFIASGAAQLGESSTAVVALRSKQVLFADVDVVSGDGKDGAVGDATQIPQWTKPMWASGHGQDIDVPNDCIARADCGSIYEPRVDDVEACALTSRGGNGLFRRCPGTNERTHGGWGAPGGNCGVGIEDSQEGEDGLPSETTSDGVGLTGEDGASGKPSAAFGAVVDGAYAPPVAGAGAWGRPGGAGRGGRGGGYYRQSAPVWPYVIGGGGGQGGYPGCGGSPGNGGGGGGGSFGAIVDHSGVRFVSVHFTTGHGGKGGIASSGGPGEPPGDGARGGEGRSLEAGERGHPGGSGGKGGSGGPGAGGPSIGVAYVGEEPALEKVLFDLGPAGEGAVAGQAAENGLRVEVHQVGE